MWDWLYCWDPIFLLDSFFIFQRLKCQKVLNLECLFTTDLVSNDVGFQLSSQQFTTDKEFKMKRVKDLLIESGLQKLFEKFVAFGLIHFSWKINLGGINLVFSKSGNEFSNDLFRNFVVKLLDFVKLFHGRKRLGQMVKFIIISINL